MEYQGWTLYDEVTLVIRTELTCGYKYPQAYVVDTKNKKQLETATNWGNRYNYEKDEKTGEVTKTVIPPIIKTVKNDGFTIELLDSANGSYQGGKLSFWNCLITKESDDIKCVVGINVDLLLTLLLQNNFIKGKCENSVQFARKQGNVGVLTEEMVEYKEALKDMQSKKDINKKKTSKWEIGRNYKTLTIDETYLGTLYKPFKTEYKYDRNYGSYTSKLVMSNSEYPKKHFLANSSSINGVTKLTELKDKWIELINDNMNRILNYKNKSTVNSYDLIVGIELFNYYALKPFGKLPARQQGELDIEIDMDLSDFYNEIIDYAQSKLLELLETNDKIHLSSLEYYLIRPYELTKNNLNDTERKLLYFFEESENTILEIS